MSAVTDMLQNVEDQVLVYRRLLDLSRAQLTAVQQQDVRTVHALLQELEQALLERSRVDQRRALCLAGVALELGIPLEDVTASRMAELTGDDAVAERIRAGSRELGSLVEQLDHVVEVNKRLLEHELEVIDHVVQGIARPVDEGPQYASTGAQRAAGERVRLLDLQA